MYINKILFLVTTLAIAGCATVKAPRGQVPRRPHLETDVYGGWVVMHLNDGKKVEGELLAIHPDTAFVMGFQFTSVAVADVKDARLIMYHTDEKRFAAWTLAGTITTPLTTGLFFIVTAPVWLITGITTSVNESKRINYLDYPAVGWSELNAFARFPQGLPTGLNRQAIKAKVTGKK